MPRHPIERWRSRRTRPRSIERSPPASPTRPRFELSNLGTRTLPGTRIGGTRTSADRRALRDPSAWSDIDIDRVRTGSRAPANRAPRRKNPSNIPRPPRSGHEPDVSSWTAPNRGTPPCPPGVLPLHAFSGSAGVGAVVTALCLQLPRPSVSAPGSGGPISWRRAARACGDEQVRTHERVETP